MLPPKASCSLWKESCCWQSGEGVDEERARRGLGGGGGGGFMEVSECKLALVKPDEFCSVLPLTAIAHAHIAETALLLALLLLIGTHLCEQMCLTQTNVASPIGSKQMAVPVSFMPYLLCIRLGLHLMHTFLSAHFKDEMM